MLDCLLILCFRCELDSASEATKVIIERNSALQQEIKEKIAKIKSLEKEVRV